MLNTVMGFHVWDSSEEKTKNNLFSSHFYDKAKSNKTIEEYSTNPAFSASRPDILSSFRSMACLWRQEVVFSLVKA